MEGIPLFNPSDFKKVRLIGIGSFGRVHLVENIKTHNKYAAKEPKNQSPKDNFEKEMQTYKKANNAAVLSLLGYSTKNFESKDKMLLFTDYMSNGSLDDFLKKHKKSEKKTKYIILLGVALGMKYLHWQGIIHRDLKPANVLLNDKIEPKICDFGESEVSDKEFTDILMENTKGTPLYMAPEIFDREHPYNYKVDVYAFSFFAYELITRKKPFEEKHFKNRFQLCKAVKAGERPDLSVINDSYVKEFLEKCWSQKPSDRPSFLEIVDELMNDKFKEFFGIKNKEDIEKVDQYLQLFDDDLKSPNSKDALDWKKKADEGDIIAILQYAHMLYIGYGALMNKEEAVKYWMKATDLGNSLAMYQIAYCLRHGFGIEKNIDESIRYYKMAAEKGNSVAMINLGHMYFKGDEIQADSNEAFKYYTLAAKYGNVNALINIGNMFYYGRGKPENKKLGLQFYKKAADLGSEQAMFIYGKLLIGDSVINNESITESKFNEAMNYLKMSAEKGYVDAMAEYAINRILKEGYSFNDPEIIRYLKLGADHGNDYCKKLLLPNKENDISIFLGQSNQELKELADAGDVQAMVSYAKMLYSDVTEDKKEEASKYFKMAADLGDPHAMFEYGKMLVNGDGIPEKKKEGIQYLTSSVISRNIEVMYLYGQLRRKGEGIPVDLDEASRYIKLSADRGYEPALFAYGQMLLRGEGVPINKEKGIKYIEESTFLNGEMMYEYGEMLRKGEDVAVDKKKAAEYFRKASELEEPRAILSYGSMKYFGEGIPVNKKDGIRLIKLASDKGLIEAKELFEKLTGKNSENKEDIISIIDSNENENETNDSSKIKVNIYKPTTDNGAKNFMYLKHTIPQQIRDDFENEIKKYDFFNGIQRNLVHPDDPNTLYTVYYFKEKSNYTTNIITSVMKRHGINFVMVEWKHDFFFDENIVPQNVLKILKTHMRRINYINGINKNICDGRQIATYIRVSKQLIIDTTKEVNQSIQKVLLPKGLVFDKIKYPLENDIIINEKMILKNKDDFDLIIEEIKKIGINPINIERNRLYLYGNYFVKKLFEIFSFICFQNENDKMIALNHINSLAYSNKKNVLKYKMNLHYCKISTAYYPKVVRDNLSKIFQSFKGFQDIQENVLSIENPYERTYVGFDSVKSLKKSYIKFLHFVDILRYDVFDPKIFYKKKDLKYLIIEGNIDDIDIEDIIPKKIISDIQENCTEFKGNRFAQPYSDFINVTFIGFDSNEKLTEAYNLILNCNFKGITVSKYHEFKTFLKEISEVPEGYLFYDSL